jgi:hypothetical protein
MMTNHVKYRATYRPINRSERLVRRSESIAPTFDILLQKSDRAARFRGARLLASSRAERVATRIVVWKSAAQQSQLGAFFLERCNLFQPVVTVDLEKTIESVKILEALVRLCLDEVILSVNATVLARMRRDRRSLLKRIQGGNSLLIIAAASRFYLRLFSVTRNNPLRRSIFSALGNIKIRSPYLLDIIDRSALDTATQQMLDAATAHDIVRARAAFDVLLGNGPLAR